VRIAFFGLPLAAVLLDRDGHEIVYAAASRRSGGLRRLRSRVPAEALFLRPDVDSAATYDAVKERHPDLIVSWFWTTKLPPRLLSLAPSVGVHPSLLPRHRGPDPYFWTLDAGDANAGVTAHALSAQYDTGPILGRRELRVDSRWNAWDLARALDRPGLALLRAIAGAYARGEPPEPVAQDERAATLAPLPTEADLEVRWSWTADAIARRVRAAAPWPGAWTQIGSAVAVLEDVRVTAAFPKALLPGEAAVRADGVAVVRAADAAVELVTGRLDGEGDGPLSAGDFARLVFAARAN
jgi:methionyl-tRNA formyltransferase